MFLPWELLSALWPQPSLPGGCGHLESGESCLGCGCAWPGWQGESCDVEPGGQRLKGEHYLCFMESQPGTVLNALFTFPISFLGLLRRYGPHRGGDWSWGMVGDWPKVMLFDRGRAWRSSRGWGLWTRDVTVGSGAEGQSWERQIGWRILTVGPSRGQVSASLSHGINEHQGLGNSAMGPWVLCLGFTPMWPFC